MKIILQISSNKKTLYTMPDELYELLIAGYDAYIATYHSKPTIDRLISTFIPEDFLHLIKKEENIKPSDMRILKGRQFIINEEKIE